MAAALQTTVRLGDRVRQLRAGMRWTLTDLAAAAGLREETVSLIERNASSPQGKTLVKLATALRVPVQDLMLCGRPDMVPDARTA
jgi:transcriptional regulator with XRE-family HTH domain